VKSNRGKLKIVKSRRWKRPYRRRRKNLPSNTILMGVAVLLFSAAYYYENTDISLAALTEKVKSTLAPAPVLQQSNILKGRITHVRDGDTFEVNGIPVRISALDCPENSTSAGQRVTRFAKRFKGKTAVCELTGAKTYDRVVGYCSIDGKDFGRTMMDQTSCKLWAKYDVWNRY
jgi:endonuclease YncB( thermonuclease family)